MIIRFYDEDDDQSKREPFPEGLDLDAFSQAGVLPMVLTQSGDPGEPIEEAIICSHISGGYFYIDNMPVRLTLIRRLKDGTEYTASYVQSSHKP